MSTTASQLARSFGIVIRQIADLLMMLQDYHALAPNLPRVLDIANHEVLDLQMYLEGHLKPTWDWLITIMDSTEAQLRFGSVLSNATNPAHPSHPMHASYVRSLREQSSREEQRALQVIESNRRRARTGVDGNSARRDFLTYALSLMRSHNDEHSDNLPTIDISALKHVAYVLDALIYYMRSGNDGGEADGMRDSASVQSWQDPDDNLNDEPEDDPINQSITMETDSMDGESDVVTRTGRKHPFFQRSDSTIFLGCVPPDPFQVPLVEALPLADQPHLLHPYSRKEELFGVPRQTVNPQYLHLDVEPGDRNQQPWPFDRIPTHMALSYRTTGSVMSLPLGNQHVYPPPNMAGPLDMLHQPAPPPPPPMISSHALRGHQGETSGGSSGVIVRSSMMSAPGVLQTSSASSISSYPDAGTFSGLAAVPGPSGILLGSPAYLVPSVPLESIPLPGSAAASYVVSGAAGNGAVDYAHYHPSQMDVAPTSSYSASPKYAITSLLQDSQQPHQQPPQQPSVIVHASGTSQSLYQLSHMPVVLSASSSADVLDHVQESPECEDLRTSSNVGLDLTNPSRQSNALRASMALESSETTWYLFKYDSYNMVITKSFVNIILF